MPQQPNNVGWSLTIARLFIGASVFLATLYLGRLVGTVDRQADQRDCAFLLNTETDRVDSEIAVKQAQIFEAAILRSEGDTTSPEIQGLARELQVLIQDRTIAYEERATAEERC